MLERNTQIMKHIKYTAVRVLALCFVPVMLCLASCGMTLSEIGSSQAQDKESGKIWKHASTCYEAIELGDKVGKLKVTSKESYELYEVVDMDAEGWLATEEKHILYTEDVTLPTLDRMNPTAMLICVENETSRVIHTMQDAEKLSALVTAFTQNQSITYPSTPVERSYRVRFTSPTYPGIYYSLTYIEYASDYTIEDNNYGKYFLYNAFDKIFVPVGDEIHTALGLS